MTPIKLSSARNGTNFRCRVLPLDLWEGPAARWPDGRPTRYNCPLVPLSRCKILLLLLSPLLVGFEWDGRLERLHRELEANDPARRREVVRLLASYPAPAVRDALLQALGDPDAGVRTEAAQAAGRVRLKEAVPRLLDWLGDADADVRTSAARALGEIGATRAVPPLVRLLGDRQADVRKAGVAALASIGTPEVVVPMLGRLDDSDTSVRKAAAEALGALGDPQAIVPLMGRLRDDSPEVRQTILAALGDLGNPRATAGLLQGLADPDPEARLIAIGALGRLGAPEAVPSLVPLVDEANHRVARAAVAALGAIGGDRADDAVIASLARRETRATAASVLVDRTRGARADPDATAAPEGVGRLAEALDGARTGAHATAVAEVLERLAAFTSIEPATEALLHALESGHGAKGAVMRALGATGSPRVLVPLLEQLATDDAAVQRAAVAGLEALLSRVEPDGRAADPLLAALGRVPEALRPRVVRLLGAVGAERAVPNLRELLDSRHADLRLAAVEALGTIGDPGAASALLPLLADDDAQTRFEAGRSLAHAATARTVDALLGLLMDDAPRDRHAVLLAIGGALGRLHDAGEVPPELAREARARLGGILASRDRSLAARGIDALSRWGAADNAPMLERVLRTGPPPLRRQAMGALDGLGGERARLLLRQGLAQSGDLSLQAVAAAGLGQRGTSDDVPALLEALREGAWPLPAAAAFGLARLVRRGEAGDAIDVEGLCDDARTSRDPYVRANLAAIFASRGGVVCAAGPDPARWLEGGHAPAVRAAGARWLAAQADQGDGPADRVTRPLEACAEGDPSPAVAHACAEPGLPPLGMEVDAYAHGPDGAERMTDRWVALRLADGTVWVARTDLNGHLRLPDAPDGALVLEDPLSAPLER